MLNVSKPTTVDDYLQSGSRKVRGWLAAESASLVKVVSDAQILAGTTGSVGEIGVHHGRLFILLYLLAQPSERAFAIDIFDAQHLNIDGSGEGDRTIFESHLQRVGADLKRIDILATSSLDVSSEDLQRLVGGVRLISVDGGHTSQIALNDLGLAEATLTAGGVVILDDVFQSLFPGVSAALARYLLGYGALVPFAVSPEKVLLTQLDQHDRLLDAVCQGMGGLFVRCEDYFGYEVAVIRNAISLRERLQMGVATTAIYRRLRQTRVCGALINATRPTALRVLGR